MQHSRTEDDYPGPAVLDGLGREPVAEQSHPDRASSIDGENPPSSRLFKALSYQPDILESTDSLDLPAEGPVTAKRAELSQADL